MRRRTNHRLVNRCDAVQRRIRRIGTPRGRGGFGGGVRGGLPRLQTVRENNNGPIKKCKGRQRLRRGSTKPKNAVIPAAISCVETTNQTILATQQAQQNQRKNPNVDPEVGEQLDNPWECIDERKQAKFSRPTVVRLAAVSSSCHCRAAWLLREESY